MVFNKLDSGFGKFIVDGGVGYFCIVELCMIEIIEYGVVKMLFFGVGDIVWIEMLDEGGQLIFGVIE